MIHNVLYVVIISLLIMENNFGNKTQFSISFTEISTQKF